MVFFFIKKEYPSAQPYQLIVAQRNMIKVSKIIIDATITTPEAHNLSLKVMKDLIQNFWNEDYM